MKENEMMHDKCSPLLKKKSAQNIVNYPPFSCSKAASQPGGVGESFGRIQHPLNRAWDKKSSACHH